MLRQMTRARTLLAAPLAALLALSCAAQERPHGLDVGAPLLFEQAQLLKPQERPDLGLAFTLAPLILQEVRGTNGPLTPAKVFFQLGVVRIRDRDHAQMTYWWHYDPAGSRPLDGAGRREPVFRGGAVRLLRTPSPLGSARPARDEAGPLRAQGVCLTLDSNGVPVIYEVLASHGKPPQLFVTQSLEAAARAEFGAPLPGCHHTIERSTNDAPDILLARVIDDPPAVMGPILYLRAATHEVATLICRCMPSQARELVGQGTYQLAPPDFGTAPVIKSSGPVFSMRFPESLRFRQNDLSSCLRLPSSF
jgi:hypothetical protein